MDVDAPDQARTHIETAWTRFMTDRNLKPALPGWRTLTAGDGTPMLSARVVGPGAAHALARFIDTGPIGLPLPGDTRPTVDFSTPGRVAYVWRSHGVWIELWVPDSPVQAPESTQRTVSGVALTDPVPPALSTPRSFVSRASGRLPFTRRTKTPKETPAA